MSNFEKVLEFMNTAGQSIPKNADKKVFDSNPKLISFRNSLIDEEVDLGKLCVNP